MIQRFVIPGRLPGLNEINKANRTNYHIGSRQKKESQELVEWQIKAAHLKPHKEAVRIHYTFYEQPRNGKLRDKSNISAGAVKVIEDALVELGIIRDDGWQYVVGDTRTFYRVTENPRIEVELEDVYTWQTN